MNKPSAFLIHHDNKAFVDRLDEKQTGMLFKAIFNYEVDGVTPDDLPDVVDMAFQIFKMNLDKSRAEYTSRCEARAEAGRKGGLAKARNARSKPSNAKNYLANLPNNNSNNNKKEKVVWANEK